MLTYFRGNFLDKLEAQEVENAKYSNISTVDKTKIGKKLKRKVKRASIRKSYALRFIFRLQEVPMIEIPNLSNWVNKKAEVIKKKQILKVTVILTP